jgi:hypothetical protein
MEPEKEEKNKIRGPTVIDIKIYYETIVNKAL